MNNGSKSGGATGGNTLRLGSLRFTQPPPPIMKDAGDFKVWHNQIQGKLNFKRKANILSNMQHGAVAGAGGGGGGGASSATKAERNAATYARFEREYEALLAKASSGAPFSEQETLRLHELPTLMSQYAPPSAAPSMTPAPLPEGDGALTPLLERAGAGGMPSLTIGRNLPSPGRGLYGFGMENNMFGGVAGYGVTGGIAGPGKGGKRKMRGRKGKKTRRVRRANRSRRA